MRQAADRIGWKALPAGLCRAALLLSLAAVAAGCARNPTPYQPLKEGGGFEESRLQEELFRVSFRGNRYTPETDVIDYVFLRCAEVTLDAGYTHFTVEQDYGRTQADLLSAPRSGVGLGFGFGGGRSFWGMGFSSSVPQETTARVNYHLAMFVIRVYRQGEKGAIPDKAFDAAFLVRSLRPKAARSLAPEEP